jgi:hypothetical protein
MSIVQRIKAICLKPREEWGVIAGESASAADLLKNYALPLAAVGAVAGFIGSSIVGIPVAGVGLVRIAMVTGLIDAALSVALSLVNVYVLALIIDGLAPKFGGEKNAAQALKVAVYSYTPAWVAGALRLLPLLGALALLASCYSVYLLYLGLPRLMKTPQEKAISYTAVVVLCAIGLLIVGDAIARTVTIPQMTGALPSGL